MKIVGLAAAIAVFALTTLRAQDVGFTNAWLELDPQGREHVTRYAEDFKAFLGKAKSEMQFVREAVRFPIPRPASPPPRAQACKPATRPNSTVGLPGIQEESSGPRPSFRPRSEGLQACPCSRRRRARDQRSWGVKRRE